MPLDGLERLELIEQVVLEDRVELVLKAGENCNLVKAVDSLLLECPVPLHGLEIVAPEVVKDGKHASHHLRLVEVVVGSLGVFLGPFFHCSIDRGETWVQSGAVDIASVVRGEDDLPFLCLE